jgi:hypothetical protein
MWRIGLVLGMTASLTLAAEPPVDPFAFRGVKLPVSVELWQEKLPYFTCEPSPDPRIADVSCAVEGAGESTMYAGHYGRIEAHAFRGTVGLVSVVWGCNDRKADELLSHLDRRFGKRTGTKADEILESPWWNTGGTEVRFMGGIDRNGNIIVCSVTYQTDGYRAESARRQKADLEGRNQGM